MKSTKFSTAASTIKPTRTALQRFNITSDVPHPVIRYVMNKPKNETKHQILLGTLRNTKHQIWVSPSVDCRPSASTKTLLSDEDDEEIHIGTVVRLSNEGQIEMDAFFGLVSPSITGNRNTAGISRLLEMLNRSQLGLLRS